MFWAALFGNDRPVEVEIGAGTGTFLVAAARRAPETNFLGIERSYRRVIRAQPVIAAAGTDNVRLLTADAACVVCTILPPLCVRAYHIYFPDPWWKRRHHRRRLMTASLAAALIRTLEPGGRLYLATDVDETFALMLRVLGMHEQLELDPTAAAVRTVTTVFERKGLGRGAAIHDAVFVKRDHASSAAPMTPAESPSWLRRMGVRSSSLNT